MRRCSAGCENACDAYIEEMSVEHLRKEDALGYLERVHLDDVSITDPVLREAIFVYAKDENQGAHPYFLGLCADVALQALRWGEALQPKDYQTVGTLADKERQTTARLLRYVDEDVSNAVRAMSVCRAFDRDLYRHVASALHFDDSNAAFRILTRFSFVRETDWHGER